MRRPAARAHPPAARAGFARAAMLLAIGVLLGLIGRALVERVGRDADDRREIEFERALRLVQRSFVEPRDTDRLLDGALRGLVAELDPYSRYYDQRETGRLERETTGQYDGIGVLFAPDGPPWQVLFPIPDSPAIEAGLRVGDRLVSVAGEDADTLDFPALRELLGHGERGPVRVEVEGLDGAPRSLEVTPSQVLDPSVRRIELLDADLGPVGYLSIGTFTRRTAEEFDRAVDALRARGARALVIDLRGNLGGVLDGALAIADRFVRDGALLSTETREGIDVSRASAERTRYHGMPLALLVDGNSASASEVLAGALQDHRVGVLVGEPTYGKGTVQTLTRLPELEGVLRVTTAVYRTPSGRLIERSLGGAWNAGLAPDIEVPVDAEQRAEIASYLGSFGPRLEHQSAVAAWERRDGVELVRPHPDDPPLRAALDLLAGRRPTPPTADSASDSPR